MTEEISKTETENNEVTDIKTDTTESSTETTDIKTEEIAEAAETVAESEKSEEATQDSTEDNAAETEAAVVTDEAKDEVIKNSESESNEVAETAEPAYEIPVYTGDKEGETYTFSQLERASDDYDDSEYNQMVNMYEGTLNQITEKEIVTGRVIGVDEKYVIVDIGFKSEGIIPVNEFRKPEELQLGAEVDVFLDKVEDREGQLILSKRKANTLKTWQLIEDSHETQFIIEGYIKRRIKGGMVVDIEGIDAFLPGSQIDVRPVRDFDAYVGKTMEFLVVKLNMSSENVVVSHRAIVESDLEDQRAEILSTMEPGQVLEGHVKNITDFGVFIDLGGVDGLLHITDLSWGRVEHPSEIVQLDQKLNVVVLEFDENTKRISLGLKQLQPHPWDSIDNKFPEGNIVQGRVVSIADYGAFVELERGIEGLVHISEMSWTQHIKHPSQLVDRNAIIECVVLNINKDEKKISLGVKQLENDPWQNLLDRYPINSKHKGTVRNLTNFGVFVELEPGIDGLVHISDLSWTDKINHPGEKVDKGNEIEVVILAVDFDNRRITLGHKQIESNPWETYLTEFAKGTETEATVSKTSDKGLFVDLGKGAVAFLPKEEAVFEGEFADAFKSGDKVKVVISACDETDKVIEASQKKIGKVKKGKAKKATKKAAQPEALTLGEMSGLSDLKRSLEKKEKSATKKAKAQEKDDSIEEATDSDK